MTDQERQDILAVVGADDWRAVVREQMEELGWGPDRLAASMCDAEYYVTGKTVRRWLSDIEPKLDSIRRMALARYLSWNRVVDALRPTRTPRILRRLALVPVFAVLLALVPMPAQALTTLAWGPGGTEMGASSPVYTQPIRVIDTLIGTLRQDRRPYWRAARDQALAAWGLPFTVERGTATYPWTVENINSGLAIQDIVPGAIIIVRNYATDTVGSWVEELGGGIAAYHPWAPWWKDYYRSQLAGVIGHEIGHCLGFGHGGTGIMNGAERPNAEEFTALHAYWG